MKKVITLCAALLSIVALDAQSIEDALRYSTPQLSGTARFRAMSGAFGALGGDLSAMSHNPAGSAVFINSELGISATNYDLENESSYFGTFTTANESQFDISQFGAVFVFDETGGSDWRKVTLGFNYELSNNFDEDLFAAGVNNVVDNEGVFIGSIDTYFLAFAQGVPVSLLELQEGESIDDLYEFLGETEGFGAQQAFLGYQGFILDLDPEAPNQDSYLLNGLFPNGADHEYTVISRGYNRKFTVNLGTQYKENLFLGANLNVHDVNFRKLTILDEIGFDDNGEILQQIYFENDLFTFGEGFSFQVGGIAKVNDDIRLGLSYQSPTWYRLNDELIQYVETLGLDPDFPNDPLVVDPRVINIYDEYRIKTPAKLMGSFAYVFGKEGLISFDYIRTNFADAELRPDTDPAFQAENALISDVLTSTNEFRVGGEYRINQLRLRGGYRFAESPYEDGQTVGDFEGYSLGLGYDFGGAALDLAYQHSEQERNQQLFNVGLVDAAQVNGINNNVTLSFTLKL